MKSKHLKEKQLKNGKYKQKNNQNKGVNKIAVKKKIKKTKEQKSLKETPKEIPEPKKCKRGSKFCKNAKCNKMIPIHTSVCPDCQTDQKLQKAIKKKNESSEILEKLKKKKVLISKNLQQAFAIKKSMTFLDEFNRLNNHDKSPDFDISQNFSSRIFQPNHILHEKLKKCNCPHPSLGRPPLKLKIKSNSNSHSENIELQSLNVFNYNNNNNNAIMEMINVGFPISALAWANRVHDQSLCSEYLAIGVCSVDFSKEGDELSQLSRKILNLNYLQLDNETNKKMSQNGHILIYKVVVNTLTKTFEKTQLVYTIQINNGGIFDIKWSPKPSNSKHEIGLLSVLTSDGRIVIYSLPILQHPQPNQVFELQCQVNIFLPEITISAFDWLNNEKNDILACGDQNGNIFLAKISETESKFEIIKTYYQAHSEEITDLRFFPCNSEENPLFSSSSNDGFLKIFDTHNYEIPLFEIHISKKKVFNILWDKGGKFIVVNREGTSPSSILISFFPLHKVSKMKIRFLDKFKLMQVDSKPNSYEIDSILQSQTSNFSKYIYFSDAEGSVFYAEAEVLRKISSKKKKKTPKNNGSVLSPIFKSKYSLQDKTFYCEVLNEIISEDQNQKEEKYVNDGNIQKSYVSKNKDMSNNNVSNPSYVKKTLNFNHGLKALAVSPNQLGNTKKENNEDYLCEVLSYGNLGGLLVIELRKNK